MQKFLVNFVCKLKIFLFYKGSLGKWMFTLWKIWVYEVLLGRLVLVGVQDGDCVYWRYL